MIYVDTSVWVALLTQETETLRVDQWFGSNVELEGARPLGRKKAGCMSATSSF